MNKIRLVAEFDTQTGQIRILEGPMADGILFLGLLEMLKTIYHENRNRQAVAAAGKQIVVPELVTPPS